MFLKPRILILTLILLIVLATTTGSLTSFAGSVQQYGWVDLSKNLTAVSGDLTDITGYNTLENGKLVTVASGNKLLQISNGDYKVNTITLPGSLLSVKGLFCSRESSSIWAVSGINAYLYNEDKWSGPWTICPKGDSLTDIWFSSTMSSKGLIGYAASEKGGLYQVEAFSSTVKKITTPSGKLPVHSIWGEASNPDIVYAAAGTSLYKSSDGGNKWTCVLKSKAIINSMYFKDKSSAWTVGEKGSIYKYKDGQWVKKPTPVTSNLNSISFEASGKKGWAVGDKGTILYSSDSGETWKIQSSPKGVIANLTGITVLSANEAYITGKNRTFLVYTLTDSPASTSNSKDPALYLFYGDGKSCCIMENGKSKIISTWPLSMKTNFDHPDYQLLTGDEATGIFCSDGIIYTCGKYAELLSKDGSITYDKAIAKDVKFHAYYTITKGGSPATELLPDEGDDSVATDIFIKNGITYITGWYGHPTASGEVSAACYWKIGKGYNNLIRLDTADHNGRAQGIFVADDGTEYISGYYLLEGNEGIASKSVACYWKSGIRHDLPFSDSSKRPGANKITVVNNKIYVTGSFADRGDKPCYWVNDKIYLPEVSDLPGYENIYNVGLAVSADGTVYIGGTVGNNIDDKYYRACYWVNTTRIDLDEDCTVRSIAIDGSNVYCVGFQDFKTKWNAVYWKNDQIRVLGRGGIFDIFLIPAKKGVKQ